MCQDAGARFIASGGVGTRASMDQSCFGNVSIMLMRDSRTRSWEVSQNVKTWSLKFLSGYSLSTVVFTMRG